MVPFETPGQGPDGDPGAPVRFRRRETGLPLFPDFTPAARKLLKRTTAARSRRRVLETRQKADLWTRIEADARRIASRFGLNYRAIEPEREGVKRHYGITYRDGTIRIRLKHARTGRPLKYSSLINTVCHELAHLKHFNHGPRFKRYYLHLLEWARSEGIYRPSTTESPPPVQMGLSLMPKIVSKTGD